MAVDGYFPKITLPSNKSDIRKGDGVAMIVNGKVMVIDAYEGSEATKGLISWLKSQGVTTIDLAVCTHAHGDHFGGFYTIVETGIKINQFRCYHIDSIRGGNAASREDSDNLLKLIRWLQARGTIVQFVDKGSELKFEDTTWRIYRNQPAKAADDDDNAWEYVNNGSLVLWSPEIEVMFPGDGPENVQYAIEYFGGEISLFIISHHGNACNRPNARAVASAGCVVAWESCVEKNGPGTTEWTEFGARRVKEAGIPVLMQNEPVYFHAENGVITIRQGNRTFSKKIPYQGKGDKKVAKWVDDGGWKYMQADGSWTYGWALLTWSKGKDWFYFDKYGYCVYGWQYLEWSKGQNWFYFDTDSAAMKTGWVYDNGSWFYLDPDTGAMRTGWIKWKGKLCYLEPVSDKNHVQGRCYINCRATIGGKLYSFDKDGYATEITGKSVMDGCDVASYQYDINPAAMTTTDFFIVKFTQGDWYTNPYADQQYAKAKAAGKLLGAYHYGEGGDPVKEARYFCAKVGPRVGECILALDWEGKSNSKFNTSEEVAWVLKFAMEVYRLTGVHIFLYMSKSVTRRRNWSEVAKDVRLWCAQYANDNLTNYQANPWTDSNGWGAWTSDTIRQYSSHGRVRGYGKNLDINKAYMSLSDWVNAAKGIKVTPIVSSKPAPKTQWAACVSLTTSPVKISNSGSDENGNYKNGKAGDQNGREWYIRDWYNRPWNCVLRHPLAEVRACIATLAYKAAQNDNIGYDQNQRDSYGVALAKADYDPSKITTPVESDCSKGVIDNVKATGYILGMPELQRLEATYTGNMRAGMLKAGFIVLTESKYLTSGDYLLAGDIVLNDAHHTATVVTNGTKSGNETNSMPLVKDGSTGYAVSQLQTMLNKVSYRNQKKLTVDGEFGPNTKAQVIFYQMDRGLTPDGEVGPITWGRLYEDVY